INGAGFNPAPFLLIGRKSSPEKDRLTVGSGVAAVRLQAVIRTTDRPSRRLKTRQHSPAIGANYCTLPILFALDPVVVRLTSANSCAATNGTERAKRSQPIAFQCGGLFRR